LSAYDIQITKLVDLLLCSCAVMKVA